ncbi:hypothetical protein XH98_37230 [Bradyrhizobium sp. CCBAU 51745]|nr:hypothetical protein [Bradyrhizobium sp. CCBAU 51745]
MRHRFAEQGHVAVKLDQTARSSGAIFNAAPLHQAPIGGEVVRGELERLADVLECSGRKAASMGNLGAQRVVAGLGSGKDSTAPVGEVKGFLEFTAVKACNGGPLQSSGVLLRIEESCSSFEHGVHRL